MLYRLRALFGGERRRSCPGQYILGILNGRAMEQKERRGQIFGAGGAIIQKKNKEKEKGKGKEERREKRKKERGEFNLEDPMFPI